MEKNENQNPKVDTPKELQPNLKSATAVVDVFSINDGEKFFIIKNVRGEVVRIARNPDELAAFFCQLANTLSHEGQD